MEIVAFVFPNSLYKIEEGNFILLKTLTNP